MSIEEIERVKKMIARWGGDGDKKDVECGGKAVRRCRWLNDCVDSRAKRGQDRRDQTSTIPPRLNCHDPAVAKLSRSRRG